MFNQWKKDGLFSLPIGEFIKKFAKYKDCLKDSEYEIFEFVEYISEKNPKATLDSVIKLMAVEANKELMKVQEPIFDSIAVEAIKLPENNKRMILNLIAKCKYRLLKIPHIE